MNPMSKNTSKKADQKFYLGFGLIVIGIVLIVLLHTTTLMTLNGYSFIEGLDGALTHLVQHPFQVEINALFFKYSFFGIAAAAFFAFFVYNDTIRNKHYTTGEESGTAKWHSNYKAYNEKYTEPYGQPVNTGENNMILTKNISLGMDSRKTLRNNNILVVGGSGAGKTRFMIKPNILQANCNYVITDPAGELLSTTGQFLADQGYDIKVFNLVEMAKSDQYNPFHYIRDDLGVLMMINCLIKNTNPDGKSGGDPFWEKSETALLQALCFYLKKYCPEHQRNFTSVMKLLRAAEVDENDASKKSKLDRIFDEVALKDPNSIALKQYLTFKMGAGKTLKSILISCSVRLTVFNMKQIENLTRIDTIDLGSMGTGKKALFVIIPAADSTYNFLVSMMYSQLFETLYFVAETQCKGQRLERPVRFLLDEFANIGQIPEFTKKLATMRKYDISCTVVLQNLAQIKTMYKDDWESIVGNCDSFLFLGGQEYSTLEYVSKELGKTTVTVRNRSMSNGKNKNSSLSFNQTARDLMTPNEIMTMPKDECICIINGLDPFYDKKFDYTIHKNYKKTGDGNPDKLYINKRDNSVTYSRECAEEQAEKRRALEQRKIYDRTKKGFEEPPIPANKAFAGVSFGPIKRPEDVREIKTAPIPTITAETIPPVSAIPQPSPSASDSASSQAVPETEQSEVNENINVEAAVEKDNVSETNLSAAEVKEEKPNNSEAVEKPEDVAEKLPKSTSDSDNSNVDSSQEVWDFTSFT